LSEKIESFVIIIKSLLLAQFPEIKFGFSTKKGLQRTEPYYFNLSMSVGDGPEKVNENREEFLKYFGLDYSNTVFQKQVHGDKIEIVNDGGKYPVSDALITNKKGIGLAVSSADCVPIFIYDTRLKIISAVHSGWRGTEKRILEKTLKILKNDFNSSANDLYAFIGPAISQQNYPVSKDVADNFEAEFIIEKDGSFYPDLKGINKKMLLSAGVPDAQIEVSELCSYAKTDLLHSYRRDGEKSGRAIGIIKMELL
jgi:polyphenol oxidase